jgi:type II secretory pathway pseudopilin PulG
VISRQRYRRNLGGEGGESLVELLIAIGILGIAIVAIVAGMATAIIASDANRKQGLVETLLRNYSEAITDPSVVYVDCATAGTYPTNPPGFTAPSGFAASVTNVRYWDGTGDSSTAAGITGSCPSNPDKGIQFLTVRVQSDERGGEKTLVVVKRRQP